MDKTQDADLEKGYETIEDPSDDDHASLFDGEEDIFESRAYEESEYEYEPDAAYLD